MRKLLLMTCLLAGCAGTMVDTADTFPLNDLARKIGNPSVSFVRTGIGRGPITITMPDGEILKGTWKVAARSSIGMAFSGGHMATAFGTENGGNVQFVAYGPRTEVLCRGQADSGHGSGECETEQGAVWAVSW